MIEEMKKILASMPLEIRQECQAVWEAIQLQNVEDAYRLWKRMICTLENQFDHTSRLFVTKSAEWIIHFAQEAYAGQIANILGAMFYSGEIGEQSYATAVKYYQIAEEFGDLTACENLGYCYYYGRDMDVDYEKAYQYFTKVAITTNGLVARYKIGDMYAYGHYVKQDAYTAFMIYQSCFLDTQEMNVEEDVVSDVAYRMGHCFHEGIGVEPDVFQAMDFLQLAYDSLISSGLNDAITRHKLHRISSELEQLRQFGDAEESIHLS